MNVNYPDGTKLSPQHNYKFDITDAVKGWKNGSYNINQGLIFKADATFEGKSGEAYKTFGSFNRASYKPSLCITYKPTASINKTDISLQEGATTTLKVSTNVTSPIVTWKSTDTTVAEVDRSSGFVTALKAGYTVVSATVKDTDGTTRTTACGVTVTIANGVYTVQNRNSAKYLTVKDGGIENCTDVIQSEKISASDDETKRITQLWKIYYLGDGNYSIRPLSKLDTGLHFTNGNADIYKIGTTDLTGSVIEDATWKIEWKSTGYVFTNNDESSRTMQVKNASATNGTTVIASSFANNNNCKWNLAKQTDAPSGVYWFNLNTKTVLSGDVDEKYIYYGLEYTSEKLGISAVSYSGASTSQNFTWSSSDTNVATVNSSTGIITGKSSGTTTITAQRSINGIDYFLTFDLVVIGEEQYDAGVRITKIDGIQYYDYTIPINKVFEEAVELCKVNRSRSYEELDNSYILIDNSTVPLQYTSQLIVSFIWFYKQVNTGAAWDIKLQNRWEEIFPNVPYLKDKEQKFEDFIFRGEKTTAEGLGNIMYGYTGRATGFGDITLYWGGGVAAQKNMTSELLSDPSQYYGDDFNDHFYIEKGYNMFNNDYPDYYSIAFNGIPVSGFLAGIADEIRKLIDK